MSKDLYNFVGTRIRAFCDKTYYGDIVFSFEQSYDGKEWTKEIEFATFYNGTEICFENDWNEGQTYIRNLRIWHLEDSEPVVHCKDCKWWEEPVQDFLDYGYCVAVGRLTVPKPNDFCSRGEKVSKYYE